MQQIQLDPAAEFEQRPEEGTRTNKINITKKPHRIEIGVDEKESHE